MYNTSNALELLSKPMSAREYADRYWPSMRDMLGGDELEAAFEQDATQAAKIAQEMGLPVDGSGRFPWAVWAVRDAREHGVIQTVASQTAV